MERRSDRSANCFNFIRLLAALQVFVNHATRHLQVQLPEVVQRILGWFPGVPVFFILSGFLLWNSLCRCDDLRGYVRKRALRLYPELWGGVLVNAAAMLVLYGSHIQGLPFAAFQVTQATVLQFWTPDSLAGYGCGTPNGSLWTVGVMLQCYLALWVIRFAVKKWGRQDPGGKRRCTLLAILLVAAIADSVLSALLKGVLPDMLGKLLGQTFIPYIWLFLAGALLNEMFDRIIVLLKKFWFVFLGLMIGLCWFGFDFGYSYGTIRSLLLALAMVGFAYRFPKLTIRHDISYGLYIYHMVVINAMIALGFVGNGVYVAVALALSVVCAILSHIAVSKLKRKPAQ